jgi:hypothetical protein
VQRDPPELLVYEGILKLSPSRPPICGQTFLLM